MSRLALLHRGTRARKGFPLDLPGYPGTIVDLRPLTGAEEIDALAVARELARAKDVADPKEGDPLYDRAVMAAVLAIGCLDPDSPPDAPVPFFRDATEVLTLDRDSIVLLYEAHDAWQEECSPRRKELSAEEYIAMRLKLIAGDSLDPFLYWPRATLVSCMRFLALQPVISLTASSQPSSPIDSSSPGSNAKTASAPSASRPGPRKKGKRR